jgi:uncharacterized membrane protein YbhN (UPF0104 family)
MASFRLRSVLQVLAGVALLALLLLLAHPGRLLATLRGGNPGLVAAAALPFAAVLLLEALRIAQIFEPYGLAYGTALRVTLTSMFFGSFTPGTLGGEAYKVYFAHRRSPGLARPIALTLVLRLAGVGATLALAALYFAVYPGRLSHHWGQIHWSRPSGAAVGAAAILLALGPGLLFATSRGRELARNARAALLDAGRSLRAILPARLAGLVLASLLIAAARIVYFYLLARSFAPGLFLPDLAPVAAAATIAGVVPLTLGGLGTQEGALAAGLVLIGLPYPAAVASALLNRGFLWAAAAAGWLILAGSRPAQDDPGA